MSDKPGPIDAGERRGMEVLLANEITDVLMRPQIQTCQIFLVKHLREAHKMSSEDAVKTFVEIQCTALRTIADMTEEHYAKLLAIMRKH